MGWDTWRTVRMDAKLAVSVQHQSLEDTFGQDKVNFVWKPSIALPVLFRSPSQLEAYKVQKGRSKLGKSLHASKIT